MLNKSDALRIENKYYGKKRRTLRKNYIFKCKTPECKNTITVITGDLAKRSGLCMNCAKRNLDKPFLSTYNHIKYSASVNHPDKEFTLTYEELAFLAQIGVCHYCGSNDIKWNAYKGKKSCARSNLDRKDNTKGYTFSNVVVCCKACNFMKRDWLSYAEFKMVALLLKRWREGSSDDKQELESVLISWNLNVSVCPSESSIE